MHYLITGGAGFIGSALANRLIADGHEVRVIDNLHSGSADQLNPQVVFTRGDISDVPRLWSLLQDVDCVYHLAARVSVPESIQYPRDYNDTNVGGTVSLMEAMRDAGNVRRVVFSSSGAVYGQQHAQPLLEDMIPNPGSPYAVSKLAAETYIRTIGRLWELETVSLRVFNAYGPGQQLPAVHPPVIPHYIRSAQRGASIVVFGDGQQTRDFVYIDDVVDALVAASTASDIDQKVINIGSGVETSISALVDAVGKATGQAISVLQNNKNSAGVPTMCADLRRARDLLGYRPRVSLEDGLSRTIQLDPRFSGGEA